MCGGTPNDNLKMVVQKLTLRRILPSTDKEYKEYKAESAYNLHPFDSYPKQNKAVLSIIDEQCPQ